MRRLALIVLIAVSPSLFAQKMLSDAVKDLAAQISAHATKEQKKRVAVIPFQELDGQSTVLGTYIAEELLSHLVNSGLKIVERGMLDKILAEQKLQRTGAIDEKTAKQIGKIAGVDAIVTGSIADLQSNVGVNCRLIDTTTGDIFGAAQVKIAKDDDVKKIMAVVLTPAAGGGGGAAAPAPAGGPHTWQVESLTFSMDGLRGSGNTATTTIVVDNTTGEAKSTYVGRYYLIDNNGDRWNGHMDDGNDWANLTIAPGTKRRYRWTFAPESAATGTVFTLTNEDGTRSLVRNLTRKP